MSPKPSEQICYREAKAGRRAFPFFSSYHCMKERRYVYIIRSVRYPRKHYVGLTSNPESRLKAHNMGQSTHTAEHRPWILLVGMEFEDHNTAGRFERYLKSPSGRAFSKKHFG